MMMMVCCVLCTVMCGAYQLYTSLNVYQVYIMPISERHRRGRTGLLLCFLKVCRISMIIFFINILRGRIRKTVTLVGRDLRRVHYIGTRSETYRCGLI